jgi:hypothetical protein
VAAVKPGLGDEVWPGESVGRAHRKAGTATTLRIDVIASGPDYITSFFELRNGFQHTALAHLQLIRETAVTRPSISVVVIDEIQESAEHARGISADYIAVIGMQSKRFARLMEEVPLWHGGSGKTESSVCGELGRGVDALLCAQTPPLKARIPAVILGAAYDGPHPLLREMTATCLA